MKTKCAVLMGFLLVTVASPAFCGLDLIEMPRSTNQLLTLRLPSAEFQRRPDATKPMVIGLTFDLSPGKARPNSWFAPPLVGELWSSDVEAAERINAEAIRQQRQKWNEARKQPRGGAIPRLYPSKVEQIPGFTK